MNIQLYLGLAIVFAVVMIGVCIRNLLVILNQLHEANSRNPVTLCKSHSWVEEEETGKLVCSVCPKRAGEDHPLEETDYREYD